MNYYAPRVFITDPGMNAAIDSQYSDAYPLHCIYHISQNLLFNLKLYNLYYYATIESDHLVNNKPAEEGYDSQQIHLTSLLEDLSSSDVIKTYKIQRRHCIHNNFVIILADRSHFCTCMLLINCGLICRHFWHVMAIDGEAFFHITLIPRRWYNDEKMEDFELDEQPYMMNTGAIQSDDDHVPCPKLFPMREIPKIRGNDVFCPEVRLAVQK